MLSRAIESARKVGWCQADDALRSPVRIAAVSGLWGLFYGAFVTPLWTENVEFGQTIAGLLPYDLNNPWYVGTLWQKSLLTLIPAVFLKLGTPVWPLSVAMTAIQCAVPFMAVALVGLIFSRNGIFALIVPALLLHYDFGPNPHFYPVFFPANFFIFGNFSFFYTLLCLSVIAFSRGRLTGFLFGLAPGFHAGWGLLLWAGTGIWWILKPSRIGRGFWLGLFAGLGLVMLSAAGYELMMAPRLPPVRPDYSFNSAVHETLRQFDAIEKAGYSHNLLVKNAPNLAEATWRFLHHELVFALFALGLMLVHRWPTSEIRVFITLLLGCLSIALIAHTLEEFDHQFTWLGSTGAVLSVYWHRLIVSRWLNLDVIALPILVIGYFAYYATVRKSLIAGILLAAFVFKVGRGMEWSLTPDAVEPKAFGRLWLNTMLALGIVVALDEIFPTIGDRWNARIGHSHWASGALVAALMLGFAPGAWRTASQLAHDRRFLGHDQFDPISAEAGKIKGLLVLGDGIKSNGGYNPQLRTGRPIILPMASIGTSMLMPFTDSAAMDKRIYCLDTLNPAFDVRKDRKVRECLETKTIANWQSIAREYGASSVMVVEDWKLKLPLVMTSAGLSLYDIPVPDGASDGKENDLSRSTHLQ